jgi:hypothetical protein
MYSRYMRAAKAPHSTSSTHGLSLPLIITKNARHRKAEKRNHRGDRAITASGSIGTIYHGITVGLRMKAAPSVRSTTE